MTRKFRRLSLNFRVFIGCTALFSGGPLCAQAVPMAIIRDLSSDKFAERETAQAELREWSRKQPEKSIGELHRQWTSASDPEVKARCLAVLKELVLEREYGGEGYLGISMIEMIVQVPGENLPRRAIRIGMVMPGTAADVAGLLPNDLIVGLGDRVWRDGGMDSDFARIIRENRPGTEVSLLLLKDEKLVRKKIRLGSKPEAPGEEGQEIARIARDRFFQRWLDKQEPAKR
jgi:hypothetical protein